MKVTDCIDATLDATKKPTRNPVRDRPASHPQAQELPATDDPMLRLGKVSDPTIERTRGTLCMPGMHSVPLAGHGIDLGQTQRAGGALNVTKGARKRDSSPPVPPLALIP